MAGYFLDSSALVKRYVGETGTPWVRELTNLKSGHRIFLARITVVEVTAAIARRRRDKQLPAAKATSIRSRFRKHFVGRYVVLEMTSELLANAADLSNKHFLRAYDAVQLAAGLELNRISRGGIVFVSADRALNRAAIAEGLVTDDPNSHP